MNKEIYDYNGKKYILVPDDEEKACNNCTFMFKENTMNRCSRWNKVNHTWIFLEEVDCIPKDSIFKEYIPGPKKKLEL